MQGIISGGDEGYVCLQSLSEYFRFMTGVARPQLSPKSAERAIKQLLANFKAVGLDETDHLAVFTRMGALGLHGAVVYDALIARAGLKARVDCIVTLNAQDFLRLGADVAALVQVP
nr:hypothetical protein [Gloeobacter violaceus]